MPRSKPNDLGLMIRLHRLAGDAAVTHMRRKPRSIVPRSMKQRLSVVTTPSRAWVSVPYYWAIYLHQGRPGYSGNIIYFTHPNLDPRIKGGYPVKQSDVRHLTGIEYARLKAFGHGMITRTFVGPAKARPFFDDALTHDPAFHTKLDKIVLREIERRLKLEVKAATGPKPRPLRF